MQYQRGVNKVFARLDPGEEILHSIQKNCEREKIEHATLDELGALNTFKADVFDTQKRCFVPMSLKAAMRLHR